MDLESATRVFGLNAIFDNYLVADFMIYFRILIIMSLLYVVVIIISNYRVICRLIFADVGGTFRFWL